VSIGNVFVGKPQGKSLFVGRPVYRLSGGGGEIEVTIRVIGLECVECVCLAQNLVQWRNS
jgi:hypothetical protein